MFFYPKVINSHLLTLPSKSFKGHAGLLGKALTTLTTQLNADSLIFLGDAPQPWLGQRNDYQPVLEAQQYLSQHKIGQTFNGALHVSKPELAVFIKHLAWLVRCNASLPVIHFMDEGQCWIGNICQYGNLHISTLNEQTAALLQEALTATIFEPVEDHRCVDRFNRKAIRGRRIVV